MSKPIVGTVVVAPNGVVEVESFGVNTITEHVGRDWAAGTGHDWSWYRCRGFTLRAATLLVDLGAAHV